MILLITGAPSYPDQIDIDQLLTTLPTAATLVVGTNPGPETWATTQAATLGLTIVIGTTIQDGPHEHLTTRLRNEQLIDRVMDDPDPDKAAYIFVAHDQHGWSHASQQCLIRCHAADLPTLVKAPGEAWSDGSTLPGLIDLEAILPPATVFDLFGEEGYDLSCLT